MRDPLPPPKLARARPWRAAWVAILLGSCLNPRPEELPSAENLEGDRVNPGANPDSEGVLVPGPSPQGEAPSPSAPYDPDSAPRPVVGNGAPPPPDAGTPEEDAGGTQPPPPDDGGRDPIPDSGTTSSDAGAPD